MAKRKKRVTQAPNQRNLNKPQAPLQQHKALQALWLLRMDCRMKQAARQSGKAGRLRGQVRGDFAPGEGRTQTLICTLFHRQKRSVLRPLGQVFPLRIGFACLSFPLQPAGGCGVAEESIQLLGSPALQFS